MVLFMKINVIVWKSILYNLNCFRSFLLKYRELVMIRRKSFLCRFFLESRIKEKFIVILGCFICSFVWFWIFFEVSGFCVLGVYEIIWCCVWRWFSFFFVSWIKFFFVIILRKYFVFIFLVNVDFVLFLFGCILVRCLVRSIVEGI